MKVLDSAAVPLFAQPIQSRCDGQRGPGPVIPIRLGRWWYKGFNGPLDYFLLIRA